MMLTVRIRQHLTGRLRSGSIHYEMALGHGNVLASVTSCWP